MMAYAIDLEDALGLGVRVGLDLLAQQKHPAAKKTAVKSPVIKKTAVKTNPKPAPVKGPIATAGRRFRPGEVLFILKPNAPDAALPALVQSLKLRRISGADIALLIVPSIATP